MDLQLAVASSCTGTECQVQFLNSNVRIQADYSQPVIAYGIVVSPGDLVAVDRSSSPPQVVFRWIRTQVERRVDGGGILTDSARGRSKPLAQPKWLDTEIAAGDKVFVAYGEVHDVCIGGRPGNPERLRAAVFPTIEAMYERMEHGRTSSRSK